MINHTRDDGRAVTIEITAPELPEYLATRLEALIQNVHNFMSYVQEDNAGRVSASGVLVRMSDRRTQTHVSTVDTSPL